MLVERNPFNIADHASRLDISADTNATHIALTNLGLEYVPRQLARYQSIEVLDLSDNAFRIVELPHLPNLKVLILDRNPLIDIPEIPGVDVQCAHIKTDSELPPGVE